MTMNHTACRQSRQPQSHSVSNSHSFTGSRAFKRPEKQQLRDRIQPKLRLSQPGDRYEQEADQVADQVMRMSSDHPSTLHSPPQIQRLCPACEEELHRQIDEEEEEEEVQAKAAHGGAANVTPSALDSVQLPTGGGKPLSDASRAFFEPRFGHDFSQVRVHDDQHAASSAKALNARAYTRANDIVFASGAYVPDSRSGRTLLAHELTHVIQQGYAEPEPGISASLDVAQRSRVDSDSDIQRQADFSQVPSGLGCTTSGAVSRPPGEDVLFPVSSDTLSTQGRAQITNLVYNWLALGGTAMVTVDGYASIDGPQALNWRLSCQRARAVETELLLQGVPASLIDVYAHGETSQFSTSSLSQNRRATASFPTNVPVTPPTPTNKTVTINMTVLAGATNNAANDVTTSNNIFRNASCGLRVAAGTPQTLNRAQTRTVLGSDGLLEEPSGPTVSQEERNLVRFNRSPNRITAYYVPGFNPGKRGTSLQQPRHGVPDSLLMGPSAALDTFTHELGHVLERNSGHHPDANNLMASGRIRNVGVDQLTATQCRNFLTTTNYPV